MSREERKPLGDSDPEETPDFADEHDATTVDEDTSETGAEGEPESPRGLGGMDLPGPLAGPRGAY
jgi:hypothetical protein